MEMYFSDIYINKRIPILNPSIVPIISHILTNGFDILILTNANYEKHQNSLLALKNEYGHKLHIRISLNQFSAELHDKERGHGSFDRTIYIYSAKEIAEINWHQSRP